jgi:hypothetical protein
VGAFKEWMMRLLHSSPEGRFDSAQDAVQDLEDCERKWRTSLLGAALELDERIRKGESLNDCDLTPGETMESIIICKLAGNRDQAVRLYERTGFDFSIVPEELHQKALNAYNYCKRPRPETS